VELVGGLFVLAREGAPSEMDQWELAELEPHSEMGLLLVLEAPSEMRGIPWKCRGWSQPRECRNFGVGVGVGDGGRVGYVLITVAKILASCKDAATCRSLERSEKRAKDAGELR
jgi:hypothetical protein